MKTAENEAVQQYLTAVEREASALPAERRQELLADLAEHIDVTLAERRIHDGGQGHDGQGVGADGRDGADADAVRDVLRELGDPRTIAATALRETATALGETDAGQKTSSGPSPALAPARSSARLGIPAWIAVLLLAVATPLGLVLPGIVAGLVRIAGVVMLWVTPRWTTAQKVLATLATVAAITVPNVIMAIVDPVGDLPWTILHAFQVLIPLAVSGWLWVARDRD